jgi:hypothetical protein
MTWVTWRQFRTATWIATGGLASVAVLLAVTGRTLAAQWTSSGAATCRGPCSHAVDSFVQLVASSVTGVVYDAVLLLTYAVPPLIGIFWGAPLIARELETGTHRLAWTQSVTRTRWLATKLAVTGAATTATAGLLSWAVTVWSYHVDFVQNYRITPLIYPARGVVPIGYALFALMVGVTMGMLIRRTVPAMAATLAIYVATLASMTLWVRAHLLPATHSLTPLNLSEVRDFLIGPHHQITLTSGVTPDNAWVLANTTITRAGHLFTGPANPRYCRPNLDPSACLNWVGTLGLRQDLTYHPASHFWPLQWTETGILIGVALLLAGFCIWSTRRRLT